jgi:hypothetical protein
MPPRHAAALALIGWYLMMAPTFRNPQTDSFTVPECAAVGLADG